MENVKKALSHTLFSVSAIVCCFSPAINATVINFDGYDAGTIINNQYADLTVSAVNRGGGPNVAVTFDTTNPTGGSRCCRPMERMMPRNCPLDIRS